MIHGHDIITFLTQSRDWFCPPPFMAVQLIVGYKDNYRFVIEMQVDHSGLWDVSGAWEVLIWRGETVREELASSVCLDAQDSTHAPHTRPHGETCIVLCTSVCEGDEFGYFVCEHVTVLLRTDQSRTRTLRNFQAASLLCLWLEVGLWEWKNAQMYFENQHSLNSAHSRGTQIPTPEPPIID